MNDQIGELFSHFEMKTDMLSKYIYFKYFYVQCYIGLYIFAPIILFYNMSRRALKTYRFSCEEFRM